MLCLHDEAYCSMIHRRRKSRPLTLCARAGAGVLFLAFAGLAAPLLARDETPPAGAEAAVETPPADVVGPGDSAEPVDPGDEVALKVWSAEVFGNEGQLEKAAAEYLAAALMSDDPDIAERATEVAIAAQSWQIAGMAADRWVLLDADNLQAREVATRALLVGGDYVRAELQLLEILERTADEAWAGWPRVPPLLTPARNTERALALVDYLAAETGAEANPFVHYARSRVLARTGNFADALREVETALAIAPLEAALHAWAGRLAISQRDEAAAIGHFRSAWQTNPSDRDQALAYAELLRQAGEPDEANEVLGTLPDTPENRFTRVAFATQSGNRALANDLYEGFTTVPYGDKVDAAYQAARSAEVLDRAEEAIDWYSQLEGTEHALVATLRQASLLAELGRLPEARQLMVAARNVGGTAVQLETILVEAQLLAEADEPEAAFELLETGLERFAGNTRLLYTRSLIAVQLDRIDTAEADLRTILAAEPSNAAALNALGYTLADRTDRFEEAERLIRRAFEMEPEDPAIIDSMGWVAYRLGRLEEAERYLRQALMRQRNAEIAAHLGEVLWAQGREEEAKRVWNEGMRMDPSDRVLLETLERFGVEL